MLGDSLLVANVVEKGQKVREVYLLKHEVFYDYDTREKYEGGQKISVAVTIDSIPLFIRAGAIIPIADNPILNLHHDKVTDLHLIMAPDKDHEFTLYEDEGISNNYEDDIFMKEKISMQAGEIVVVDVARTGKYSSAVETVLVDMIHLDSAPFWVTLNNRKIQRLQNRTKFESSVTGWYYSQTLKSVLIKYKNPKGDYRLEVSFEPFDLLGM